MIRHISKCPFSGRGYVAATCGWCMGYRRAVAENARVLDAIAERKADELVGAPVESHVSRAYASDGTRIVCPLSNGELGSDNRCRLCRFIGRGHIVEADYFRVSCHMSADAPSSSIVRGATWRADWGANLRVESMVAGTHVERTQRPTRRRTCRYVPDRILQSFDRDSFGGDSC